MNIPEEPAVERERVRAAERCSELLRTIADVLDIRTVFPRFSDIANKMLRHDALTLAFVDQNRNCTREAVSPLDFPALRLTTLIAPIAEEMVIGDVATTLLPFEDSEETRARLMAAGYRSFLQVTTRAREQGLALAFWSKRAAGFEPNDVPVARHIAEHVALAVSHEQLAETARLVGEARARGGYLQARVHILSDELEAKTHVRVIGESPEWRDVLMKATQVAATDSTVLVSGEFSTGKKLIARFIHGASARSTGPFVALNCSALPEQLLEWELFGYERGAFAGALQSKPGQIELAAGGVLLLEEITEMSIPAQAQLLRLLQEREFQRVGGTRLRTADVRVIAATNRDLRKAVERGDFREDLYYFLQVFEIHIPPLRQRRADILPLSDAFLVEIGRKLGRAPAGLTRAAREALLRYEWSGNVRELRSALERAAILSGCGLINTEHLSLDRASGPPAQPSTDLSDIEREAITHVLRECRWNKSKAAQRLGLSRTQLYGRMRKYGLQPAPNL